MHDFRVFVEKNRNSPVSINDVKLKLTVLFEEDDQRVALPFFRTLIRNGKFRSILLPLLRSFASEKNSSDHFSLLLKLLGEIYDIGKLNFYQEKSDEKEHPPLNLSASGLSKENLSLFVKLLRVMYCSYYSFSRGPPLRAKRK
jgi:hypothetical protein